MIPDDLDRILLSEEQIEPSSTFVDNVMARIRSEASYPARIPFPWLQVAIIALSMTILVLWVFSAHFILRAMHLTSYTIGTWVVASSQMALQSVFQYVVASLLGTLLLIWISMRVAEAS